MTPLGRRIADLIAATGPIPVADYMALALGDPTHGYYMTRDPLGVAGDFTTAPEVSQMFGELIGAWCVATHAAIGAPAQWRLVELGPGRGTLMADMLRTIRALRPATMPAVHLVETSPVLRERQRETLAGLADPVWHTRTGDLPDGPAIIVANEFFDALPVRQFVKAADGWRERVVGLDPTGALALGIGASRPATDLLPEGSDEAPVGAVFEVNRPAEAIMGDLAGRIRREGGALLAIDYGHAGPGFGDTLQAVRHHAFTDVLSHPGEADLTAHVDFGALARAARAEGCAVHGPVGQGDFLLDLGLLERAGALGRDKSDADRQSITAAVERLAAPDRMGTLFKVLAVTGGEVALPGFGAPSASDHRGAGGL